MTFHAPLEDMRFALNEVAGLDEIARLPGYDEATPELVDAVLSEAGKLAAEVLAPLNQTGDREGAVFENGVVRMPRGFREAYRTYRDGGWPGLPFDPDFGGQGLPWLVGVAVQELLQAANMSFGLCPLLTQGAVELLQAHGTAAQKELYLTRLISGEWTGTMNLTEPQAGSDVGALKTRAVPNGDHYLITGQKIYITYGEHDLAENIVHMVLARTPEAPPGTKGISLFLVPKFLPDADGRPGPRNDLRCVSIEHKLGINASPTAVMAYGDSGGAVGYLVGAENHGMACMFTMMNNARVLVGVQGLGIAERAYQQALDHARTRLQGRPPGDGAAGPEPIIHHPDVRRMLMTMKSQIEAMRALAYYGAAALDRAKRHPDEAERARSQALIDLLTPVIKAWCSDLGCEISSLGVQVHGGMGFIEETGAAQHYRDARILPIYEGTNGIQALDLLGRKLLRDDGRAMTALIAEIEAEAGLLADAADARLNGLGSSLGHGLAALRSATDWLLDNGRTDAALGAAGASPYLRLVGLVAGGWLLARSARCVATGNASAAYDPGFRSAKLATAGFYHDNILPQAGACATAVTKGAESCLALSDGDL